MSSASKFFQVNPSQDAAAVKRMLAAEPDWRAPGTKREQSALLLTVYSGNKELCDVLQAQGIPLELHEAAALGATGTCVKQLVEEIPTQAKTYSPDGFSLNCAGGGVRASGSSRIPVEKGADVNAAATNGTGYSALTGAVASGHIAVVSWLLAKWRRPELPLRKRLLAALTAAANGTWES